MRILGFERNRGACNHHRIVQPLYKLLQHEKANILTIHPDNVVDLEFVNQKIMESEIIVFQRPADAAWLNFIKTARKHGKLIVADYDDDPFNVSPWNESYRYWGTEEQFRETEEGDVIPLWRDGEDNFHIEKNISRHNYFKASFKKVDMVSTTTPLLAETFKKLNKNTVVLPNVIDFSIFPKVEMVKKEIRIGWQGGGSHYEDLFMVAPVIKRIAKQYKNVKFVYFGDVRFHGLFKDIPQAQLEWHSWVSHAAYPYKLACLNLDIGLCPLTDTDFNRKKSAIKYFEYSAMRIPTIASNIPPYTPVITNGQDGVLVENTKNAWYNQMVELIESRGLTRGLRKRLAERAYDNVYENHNADKKVHLWAEAFEGLLKKDITEMVEV